MKRSSIWQKNIAMNIVLGFFIGILLMYLLLLGLFIDKLLEEISPDNAPVVVFNGILIYYFSFEFVIRFLVQALPTLNIETYLHLPIKKSAIVHFVAGKSIFAIGNYLALLVVIPFAFKVVAPEYSLFHAWVYIFTFLTLVYSNNFLATYVKRQLVHKPIIVGLFGMMVIVFVLLDYFSVFSLSSWFALFIDEILKSPVLFFVPVLLMIITYLFNYYFLKDRLYPDEVTVKKQAKVDSLSDIRYLKNLGLTGQLISLDLRLIWRHKRTRSIIYMAPIFLGYGFFFYLMPEYREMYGFLIFVGIFMSGGMMLNYLNYCFGYESNYFDNILVNYKDFEKYIRTKFIFGIVISSVCYILTIPYMFFGMDILLINSMTFLYNIGFLSYVLFYIATYSKKRMDLSRGAVFNYQGMGASHWLSMLPAFLLPVIIYLPFNWAGYPITGLIFIGVLGIAGLLFNKFLLIIVYKQFLRRKYMMAEGFRE